MIPLTLTFQFFKFALELDVLHLQIKEIVFHVFVLLCRGICCLFTFSSGISLRELLVLQDLFDLTVFVIELFPEFFLLLFERLYLSL